MQGVELPACAVLREILAASLVGVAQQASVQSNAVASKDQDEPSIVAVKRRKLDSLLDTIVKKKEENKQADENNRVSMASLEQEIANYTREPVLPREQCPLEYWMHRQNLYPLLSEYARTYLCIPATSAPCERLFSKAGELVSKRRGALAEDSVEDLLFLHFNRDLLD